MVSSRLGPCQHNSCEEGGPMNNNQSRPDLNWVNGHPMHAMQYGIESIVPDLWNGTKPELVINGPNKGNVIWPWLQRIPNAITAAYASAHYGIPAISFAYGSRNGNWSSWNTAKRPRNSRTYVGLVARLLGELQETHEAGKGLLPPDTYLNVNFPPLSLTCKEVEDFQWVLAGFAPRGFLDPVPAVEWCGKQTLPSEYKTLHSGCYISIALGNATSMAILADIVAQRNLINRLGSILSCLPAEKRQ